MQIKYANKIMDFCSVMSFLTLKTYSNEKISDTDNHTLLRHNI